jgi:hypothetical protein
MLAAYPKLLPPATKNHLRVFQGLLVSCLTARIAMLKARWPLTLLELSAIGLIQKGGCDMAGVLLKKQT